MNPYEKGCFRVCNACARCADKGKHDMCATCSGRNDPREVRDRRDIDDYCRCTEGVLQYRTKSGKLVIRRYLSNPFHSVLVADSETQEEQDWNSHIVETRERLDDETWDPVKFSDGTSSYDWTQNARKGF